jgi:hypothetical protein
MTEPTYRPPSGTRQGLAAAGVLALLLGLSAALYYTRDSDDLVNQLDVTWLGNGAPSSCAYDARNEDMIAKLVVTVDAPSAVEVHLRISVSRGDDSATNRAYTGSRSVVVRSESIRETVAMRIPLPRNAYHDGFVHCAMGVAGVDRAEPWE